MDNLSIFDIIVSNPPYLSKIQYEKTSSAIQLFEPKIALLSSQEGYEYFYKIASILPNIMCKKSMAFIEIGSGQSKRAINIFKANNIDCQKIVQDLQNLDRVLILNKS